MAKQPPTLEAMAAAANTTAEQLLALVQSAPDPTVPVPATLPWCIADVFGHVVTEPGRYRDLASGGGDWPARAVDLPNFNNAHIASLPTRDVAELAVILRRDLQELLATVRDLGPDAQMMFDGDQRIHVGRSLGTLIGEFVVHGHDIARALGRGWPSNADHVPMIHAGMHQVLPGWVDPTKAAGHTATYQLRLRGGPTHTYQFQNGALTVDPPAPGAIDVRISAEPVSWLLLTYGRANPTRAALTGKVLAHGRRPWLAPRLAANFLPA